GAELRVLPLDHGPEGADLWPGEHVLDPLHGAGRDVGPLGETEPVRALALCELCLQERDELRLVQDPIAVRAEARIGEEVLAPHGRRVALPEGMREAGEDEPAVARPEGLIRADVGVTGPERLVMRAERQ